ncbi:MAG TPA: hypothetical protein VGM88_15570 [Kofleriaceae bacterium]|jgi:hypothetical protein
MRFAIALLLAACGSSHGHEPDAPLSSHDGAADGVVADSSVDALLVDTAPLPDGAPPIDAFPAVLDMHLDCHNDCTLIANPPSIAVTAGTGFQVNWINTGDTPCDVAKIDEFNQVPIVLDLEPGDSYFDSVRTWCGTLFTGTFEFRIDICTLPSYIDVNCGL